MYRSVGHDRSSNVRVITLIIAKQIRDLTTSLWNYDRQSRDVLWFSLSEHHSFISTLGDKTAHQHCRALRSDLCASLVELVFGLMKTTRCSMVIPFWQAYTTSNGSFDSDTYTITAFGVLAMDAQRHAQQRQYTAL
ncbi:MAG TPA: hypothetical protein VFK47_18165 [Ktedonobacteraceae bacterium]|nr:hypothetical protein [Ktedonobacteraceae bacterium]